MHLRELILNKGFYALCLLLLLSTSTISGQYYSNVVSAKQSDLPKGVLFDVNKAALAELVTNKSQSLQLAIPYPNQEVLRLDLHEFEIHAPGFAVTEKSDQRERTIGYKAGRYYKGQVIGKSNTQAVIAIHDDEISGVVVVRDKQFNIGMLRDRSQHFVYETSDLEGVEPFHCGTLPNYDLVNDIKIEKQKKSGCTTAVEIYIECDYQMYQNFSSNTVTVTDYVNTLFAEVAVLYANENITVQLSQVTVWTTNDGYPSGTAALSSFSTDLNSTGFNGDLAHLLTNDNGSNGGVAYVNQLCGSLPYAYSDILNSSQPVPTYSWDVQVVTHELGHNFGSSHTHDCIWGPNSNQQIDDCGSQALGGGSCYNANAAIIPSGGGTIMSYCHLNGVGINFNNGFGTEPGDLIRSNHASCMCDNPTCDTALEISATGLFTAKPSSGGGATSGQATNADWFKFSPSTNGTIDISSCNEGVDTRVFVYSGSCSNLIFEETSDDDCTSAGSNTYASEIVSMSVVVGTDYYIEWDDRWSTATFDWLFTFIADTTSNNTSLSITCPAQYIAENTCSSMDYEPSVSGSATGSAGSIVTYTDVITTTVCGLDIDRTWTASIGTSSASCIQNIELTDTSAPVLQVCPNDMTIVATESDCKAFVTWSTPAAIDDCSSSLTMTSNYNSGVYFSVGSYVITYTFIDACSNSVDCSFELTVEDGCGLDPCDGVDLSLSGTLDQSSYNAKVSIQSAGLVPNMTTTTLSAGHTVEFMPGFEVELGATIEASIEDCQN